jgi:hypothetical protein
MAFLFPPVGEAPLDGTEYGRQSGRWVPVAAAGGTVPEAPTDGHIYGRQNAGWTNLDEVYMRWVPYTGPPQSFLKQDLTRDGDWTMVANKDTSDRPAPQPSGAEEDLLPIWTPTTSSAPATYTVYNEWTLNNAGWIDQYGVDILPQNTGATHVLTLRVNGVIKDSYTSIPNTAGLYWQDITPVLVLSGAVLRVTLQVTRSGSNSWYQQTGLFATPPTYCSLAVGAKDAAAAGSTAYGCHLLFTPGTASPDWDVVAYGGAAAGGGGGGGGGGTGITDGSDAAAGQIGEYVIATQATTIGIATGTTNNVTSISVSAGDWQIGGNAYFNIAASLTNQLEAWISPNAANTANPGYAAMSGSIGSSDLNITPMRLNITSGQSVSLVARATFPSGITAAVAGSVWARRMR